jgi:hypothetical protein
MELLSYFAFHTVQSTKGRISLTIAESGRRDLNPVSRRPFPLQFAPAVHAASCNGSGLTRVGPAHRRTACCPVRWGRVHGVRKWTTGEASAERGGGIIGRVPCMTVAGELTELVAAVDRFERR